MKWAFIAVLLCAGVYVGLKLGTSTEGLHARLLCREVSATSGPNFEGYKANRLHYSAESLSVGSGGRIRIAGADTTIELDAPPYMLLDSADLAEASSDETTQTRGVAREFDAPPYMLLDSADLAEASADETTHARRVARSRSAEPPLTITSSQRMIVTVEPLSPLSNKYPIRLSSRAPVFFIPSSGAITGSSDDEGDPMYLPVQEPGGQGPVEVDLSQPCLVTFRTDGRPESPPLTVTIADAHGPGSTPHTLSASEFTARLVPESWLGGPRFRITGRGSATIQIEPGDTIVAVTQSIARLSAIADSGRIAIYSPLRPSPTEVALPCRADFTGRISLRMTNSARRILAEIPGVATSVMYSAVGDPGFEDRGHVATELIPKAIEKEKDTWVAAAAVILFVVSLLGFLWRIFRESPVGIDSRESAAAPPRKLDVDHGMVRLAVALSIVAIAAGLVAGTSSGNFWIGTATTLGRLVLVWWCCMWLLYAFKALRRNLADGIIGMAAASTPIWVMIALRLRDPSRLFGIPSLPMSTFAVIVLAPVGLAVLVKFVVAGFKSDQD
jgi:hypothetical protein